MLAYEALAKVKDAEGHAHGADGKFTSGDGAGKAEDIVKPTAKPRKFESQTCTRCHGSGTYSFNLRDGNTCLGCGGKGEKHTKRGAAAAKFYTESLKTKAESLKPGDKVYLGKAPDGSGAAWGHVASVSEPHAQGKTGKWDAAKGAMVMHDNVGVTVKFTNGQVTKCPPDHQFRQQFAPEIMAEKRKAALDYMDTLTAQGTPKKAIKKSKDAEGHEHGADGKFTSGGGADAAPKKSQDERAAKIKSLTESGKIKPADPGAFCEECGTYPEVMDGYRPQSKAKYKVIDADQNGDQHACGTHVLRIAEKRLAYYNHLTGQYQMHEPKHVMVQNADGIYITTSSKHPKANEEKEKARAEKEAAKKAERAARQKAADDKKLAKPCVRRGPLPEEFHAMYKPGTDFSGRGPRGKFMCMTHFGVGDSAHGTDFDEDDHTRCHVATEYDKEHK
jgi:hypothetical protein